MFFANTGEETFWELGKRLFHRAWSLGTFFAWEALALLVTGLLHLAVIGPRWKLLLVPLWLVAGASGLSFLFLARDIVETRPDTLVGHAPAVMFGSWLCAAVVTLLGVMYGTPVVWGRSSFT